MPNRIVESVVILAVGICALWIAYTGKPVYSGRVRGFSKHKVPMSPRRGRAIATIVGVYAVLFALWIFFAS